MRATKKQNSTSTSSHLVHRNAARRGSDQVAPDSGRQPLQPTDATGANPLPPEASIDGDLRKPQIHANPTAQEQEADRIVSELHDAIMALIEALNACASWQETNALNVQGRKVVNQRDVP